MPIAYVIHSSEDRPFVHQQLIVPLPVLGFDKLLSAQYLIGTTVTPARAMAASSVVLAVVSMSASRSSALKDEIEEALKAGRRVIPVRIDETPVKDLAPALDALAVVDLQLTAPQPMTPQRVATVLQPSLGRAANVADDPDADRRAVAIAWDRGVFSTLLAHAVAQQDFHQSEELVTRLADHLRRTGKPYDAERAQADLGTLRRHRHFALMQRYAWAILAAGTNDPTVSRQCAQALIELGQFDQAIWLLNGIIEQTAAAHPESYEARGLLGRAHKQMYVNAPGPATAPLLRQAIHWYDDAFRENRRLVWHGINAATCLRRAARDLNVEFERAAVAVATDVLASLELLHHEKSFDAFELATLVEAQVVVGNFDAAGRALTEYLEHPGAHAFEVSSTHRQFEQVLQLQDHPQGKILLDRLWQAVQRHRAPLALRSGDADGNARLSVLVSVTDPNWQPKVSGGEVRARLGTVVALECEPSAIKAMLDDPLVLDITESRRINDTQECLHSVPFIRVAESYPCASGTFQERGAHALVAVIDEGIDVLHQAFLDADGKSRIVGVWDQRDHGGAPSPGFNFGTYHDAAAIAGYVESQQVPEGLGRNRDGHGTHVASIAVGRQAGAFAGGVAPDARLLVIITDGRNSIGYSHEHMAALEFIGKTADDLGVPVVVNVSQGMNSGAHDGRSPLETAFDGFSQGGSKPGRVIVKSAGNGGSGGGHASIQIAAGANDKVRWRRSKDRQWEYDCLEFWWKSGDAYEFRLVSPSGEKSQPAGVREPTVAGMFDECQYRLQLVRRHRCNGDSQLVVEIGSASGSGMPVPAGTWTLEIKHADGFGNALMDGWIERGPVPPSEFQAPHASSAMTLSVPGTANNVITVGAVERGDDESISATAFTSRGPTRDGRSKPEVSAPGVNVVAAQGGTANGAFADDGTSMAAPHVAGAVALLLSRAVATHIDPWPTSAQIGAVLQQKTRNRNAQWNAAQGMGVLDVAGLLAAFE